MKFLEFISNLDDKVKTAANWIARNALAVLLIIVVMFYLGFNPWLLRTLAIGVCISLVSIPLTGITLYALTKLKFIEILTYDKCEHSGVKSAVIIYNAMIRLLPILLYGFISCSIAISMFIAQWR